MKVNLDAFSVSGDRDGDMYLDHGVFGCGIETPLKGQDTYCSINRLIEIAGEHLKVCPLQVAEER
jgi:hypothetical protein